MGDDVPQGPRLVRPVRPLSQLTSCHTLLAVLGWHHIKMKHNYDEINLALSTGSCVRKFITLTECGKYYLKLNFLKIILSKY